MCEAAVEQVAGRLEGVFSADADYIKGTAEIVYDPATTTPAQIVEAINTQTFYRATLPGTEPVGTSRLPGGWLGLLFYLALAGGVAWLAFVRYRHRVRPSPLLAENKPEGKLHG